MHISVTMAIADVTFEILCALCIIYLIGKELKVIRKVLQNRNHHVASVQELDAAEWNSCILPSLCFACCYLGQNLVGVRCHVSLESLPHQR